MRRIFTIERIKTEYPFGVLTCDVLLPSSQTVNKKFESAMMLPPVLASEGMFDTDAVELAEGYMWVTHIFRLYQWRKAGLGLGVEPYELARISFLPDTWAEAHGLCHMLVSELNHGPLSETARKIHTICNL
jgi:hypothetical protein